MGDLARVNTNIAALRAALDLSKINAQLLVHHERVSTGKKINRASDGPAAYFISRKLDKDITILRRQQEIMERAVNFLQTNDAKLSMAADIIQELIDLAHQAKSDAVSSAEKQAISLEMKELETELNVLLTSGVDPVIRGSSTNPMNLGGIDNISLSGAYTTTDLNISYANGNLIVTGTIAQSENAINRLNDALTNLLLIEEQMGAVISRLEIRLNNAAQEQINTESNLSTIRDADLIEEQVGLAKLTILQQAAVASVIQANAAPAALLPLLSSTA